MVRTSLARLACLMLFVWGCSREGEPADLEAGRTGAGGPLRLVSAAPIDHLGELTREPMLVEHPSGALFVAGYGRSTDPNRAPVLWRSDDGGESFEVVDVGAPEEGARGNSDVDLAVAPDGTLYFASMGFDRSTGEGTHIAIGVSRDAGASWSWAALSEDRFDDRPWVKVAPDGTVHVIWNDDQGVSHAVSTDGGSSWTERPRIHPLGGSSHLAIGPEGEVAVRVTQLFASGNRYDQTVDLVAVSTDGGESWQKHAPPASLEWDPTFGDPEKIPRWVEPLAWDAEGALYHLWSDGTSLHLSRSKDLGGSWTSWRVVSGDEPVYFPYLVARGAGELAATWFSGRTESMQGNLAMLRSAPGDGEPMIVLAEQFAQDAWVERNGVRTRDTAGEYLPVAWLSNGDLAVASTIQNEQAERLGFTWRAVRIELPAPGRPMASD